jgi:hypothetical protein
MKIRHVFQKDDTGCGIACVAMLTGFKYEDVKKKIIEEGFFSTDTNDWSTSFKDITSILDIYSYKPCRKRRFKKWNQIPAKLAIASTNYDRKGVWHWVIFVRDIHGFFIYDPGKPCKRIRDLRGKMCGYFVEIQ